MAIVIKLAGGGIAVMRLIGDADAETCIEQWKIVNPGRYVSHREIPDHAIPSDREFRDAWCDVTPEAVIDVDMPKAREIHLNRIRQKRNALLDENDKYLARAIDNGNDAAVASIRERKQQLRDIPQTIAPQLEAASTIDELKAIQPL